MSIQLSTRVMHVKDQTTGSYDSVDILKSGGVDDVQINGTSVVNQGVANIPVATSSVLGAVKVDANNGVGIESQNKLYINFADDNLVKAGTGNYRPISPPRQHAAAFYGLAKASGDTTQSASTNPVGTYTEEAKAAIRAMIGAAAEYPAAESEAF